MACILLSAFTLCLASPQVLLGLLFPPLITCLGFRSPEELRTMPQTREEREEVGVPAGVGNGSEDSDASSDSDDEMKGRTQGAGGDLGNDQEVGWPNNGNRK